MEQIGKSTELSGSCRCSARSSSARSAPGVLCQPECQQADCLQVAVEESLETNYTCLTCVSLFKSPVTCVPCGHTYCRECLETNFRAGQVLCRECGDAPVQHYVEALNLDNLACKYAFKLSALHALQTLCEGKAVTVQNDKV